MPDDWDDYDGWEARDRTLLEAAAEARTRRLSLLMGVDHALTLDEAGEVLDRAFRRDQRYALVPPDQEPDP